MLALGYVNRWANINNMNHRGLLLLLRYTQPLATESSQGRQPVPGRLFSELCSDVSELFRQVTLILQNRLK